jgi:hypothetical protein
VSQGNPALADLRADLHRFAAIDDAAQRTLEVIAVIDEAAAPLGIHPTVVGGMAVYFWTEGEAFVTYDIDVVMAIPQQLAEILRDLASCLAGTADTGSCPARTCCWRHQALTWTPTRRSPRSGCHPAAPRVLSRVDILLDRLDEFQATGHQLVAQQALVLLSELTEAEQSDLDVRAPRRRLTTIAAATRTLASELPNRDEPPTSDELQEIARAALRAEYSPREP